VDQREPPQVVKVLEQQVVRAPLQVVKEPRPRVVLFHPTMSKE
jgi:hypothetical protein